MARRGFVVLPFLASLRGHEGTGGERRQDRRNGRFGELRIRGRIAIEPLILDGRNLFFIFDEDGIVLTSEGAAGVVAVFLGDGDLSVKTKQKVNELGIIVEVSLRVLRPSQFCEEDLRDASGGGLEAHFGQLRGVVAAEEIHHVILVEAILEDVFLGE